MTVLLVVDDDDDIRESLRDALTEEDYIVLTARNGMEALDMLHGLNGLPRPDIVLLDVMMPGVNGWGFLQAKNADVEVIDIPVVLLTALRSDSVRAHDPRGACLIVHKPISLEKLLAVLKCVRGRSMPPPAMAGT
jgi:DNA-binding response OmpR family regulator